MLRKKTINTLLIESNYSENYGNLLLINNKESIYIFVILMNKIYFMICWIYFISNIKINKKKIQKY